MRRLVLLAFAAVAAWVVIGVAPAAAVDDQGPPCADITLDVRHAEYTGTVGGTATLSGLSLTTAKPACAQVDYIVTINGVDYTVTPGTPIAPITIDNAPQFITVSARSQIGPHVADEAPDPGVNAPTFELNPEGSPGGGGSFG